ncbi:hypothetical protein PDUR_25930 [Paenibacillus durus]|uniref:Uncharacterized protein n=1 Tax=Paenibacillus durus TaxID=44251 RepID=A0A089HW38_PAEDU|nr:hypothetical protein PDUR_25930 [Paenibacillus durus]
MSFFTCEKTKKEKLGSIAQAKVKYEAVVVMLTEMARIRALTRRCWVRQRLDKSARERERQEARPI